MSVREIKKWLYKEIVVGCNRLSSQIIRHSVTNIVN